MSKNRFSRRDFIKSVGIAGGVSLFGLPLDAEAQVWRISVCPGTIIRRNFKNLNAAGISALKTGIQVMQSRPISDPTSWAYQAAIHGTYNTAALTAWNTCQHHTQFFLSWHRMYLCFFEKILRKASGDPSFGLPYWNYSDTATPNANFLPSAFRIPANSTTNRLYVSQRNSALNNGSAGLSPSAVDTSSALGEIPFTNFHSALESTPHDVVHGSFGGWMGFFETAAQDPIFWLHHCNIDRLWNRWLAQGGGRQNPIGNPSWMNTSFTFFNENGQQVQMKGADLVNPSNKTCDYCYDDQARIPRIDPPIRIKTLIESIIGDCIRCASPVVLDAQLITIEIGLNEKAKAASAKLLSARKREEPLALKLDFEGVKTEKAPEFFYEVYFNLPDNVKNPNYKMENYVGNLSFFGADSRHSSDMKDMPGMTNMQPANRKFSAPLGGGLKRLLSRRLLDAKTIKVTLVPTGLVDARGRKLPVRSTAKVEVERITLVLEEAGQ